MRDEDDDDDDDDDGDDHDESRHYITPDAIKIIIYLLQLRTRKKTSWKYFRRKKKQRATCVFQDEIRCDIMMTNNICVSL